MRLDARFIAVAALAFCALFNGTAQASLIHIDGNGYVVDATNQTAFPYLTSATFSFDVDLGRTDDLFPALPERSHFSGAVSGSLNVGASTRLTLTSGALSISNGSEYDLVGFLFGSPFGSIATESLPPGVGQSYVSSLTVQFVVPTDTFSGDSPQNLLAVLERMLVAPNDGAILFNLNESSNNFVQIAMSDISYSSGYPAEPVPEPTSLVLLALGGSCGLMSKGIGSRLRRQTLRFQSKAPSPVD